MTITGSTLLWVIVAIGLLFGIRKSRTIILSPIRRIAHRFNPTGAPRLKLTDEKWAAFFANQPETGMDYTVVSVFLHDGRRFDQVVKIGDHLTLIRGYPSIPFEESDISRFVVTHDKWRW